MNRKNDRSWTLMLIGGLLLAGVGGAIAHGDPFIGSFVSALGGICVGVTIGDRWW